MSKTKEYRAWLNMRRYCYEVDHLSYPLYGGRGIQVCEQWLNSFPTFMNDMGRCPGKGRNWYLHRIDPAGNYEPENCKWATGYETVNGRSTAQKIEFEGEALTVAQMARIAGLKRRTLADRLVAGRALEEATSTPLNDHQKKYMINGQRYNLKEASEITGLKMRTIQWRMKSGWPMEMIFSVRPSKGNKLTKLIQ
jgi:hypothetical protein